MQLNCLFKARDPSRSVIALSGKGVKEFLQGLNTNDTLVPTFDRGTSLYGCFLSGTGRTLFDGFMTDISLRSEVPDASATAAAVASSTTPAGNGLTAPPPSSSLPSEMVLIDVAQSTKDLAIQHFKEFKLRRKIKIVDVSDRVMVYVESIRTAPTQTTNASSLSRRRKSPEELAKEQKGIDEALAATDFDFSSPLMVPDPRFMAVEGTLGDFTEPVVEENNASEGAGSVVEPDAGALPPPLPMTIRRGYKFFSEEEMKKIREEDEEAGVAEDEGKVFVHTSSQPSGASHNSAQLRAYRTIVECLSGIPTGPRTFAPNKGLPFEGNIDQLWAVSFEKGCYLGQELTHRTHVMLVSRKRVVPLVLGHFDTREDILSITTQTSVATSLPSDKAPRLTFDINELSISGIDFSVSKGQVWGKQLTADVEYVLKTSDAIQKNSDAGSKPKAATPPAGNKLYFLDEAKLAVLSKDSPIPSGSGPNPAALVPVGHVTQGQYNVGAGLVRLRYMDPATRTMKLYIKRELDKEEGQSDCGAGVCYAASVPEYVPVTAFIPMWWADEVVEKVLSSNEAVDE